MNTHPLRGVLDDAAAGRFPSADGGVDVVPPVTGLAGVLVGMTGHFVLAADIDPCEIAERLPRGGFSAAMSATTLTWIGTRVGSTPSTFDALLVRRGTGAGVPAGMREVATHDHPRVERALRYRRQARVFVAEDAVLVVGQGVCDRWELGFEVDPSARSRGAGRAVARAAADLVPAGEPLWAQVSPGNAASMRALAAAGFVAVGAEVLFPLLPE
ncbi:MAG TPA: GNAT family N-acetyltransferase [Acidimicrobiia bacterium]|nr:GNAT family N-acetyltransferase [Acidimicrobiia bacterium]